MIQRNIFISLFFLVAMEAYTQADLVIGTGTNLVINPFVNLVNIANIQVGNGAVLTNNGFLQLKGDLSNSGTTNLGTGIFSFQGSGTQHISGSISSTFSTLVADNDIQINVPVTITSALDFQSGKITLGPNNLSIGSSGIIQNFDPQKYIVTNGIGRLVMRVGNSARTFPVGTAVTYVPFTITNAGTADFYRLRVFADVLTSGTNGSTIPSIDHAVNVTWVVEENVQGGSDLTISSQWNETDEGVLFNRSNSGIGYYASGVWNPQPGVAASGNNPYSLNRSGITTTRPFAVGDNFSPMAISIGLTLDLTEFLEGPFSGAQMAAALYPAGALPLNQPYNVFPWNYNGTESVAAIPNADVVDWVMVELRDATSALSATSSTGIAKQAAFVLKNGKIVGLDGISMLLFNVQVNNNLFAVVWHRNHLPVMSADPLINIGGTYNYNFTTSVSKVYGGSLGHKQLSPSAWGMMSGDGDANNQVNNSDKNNVWKTQTGQAGYKSGDFNLDAQVNNSDKISNWKPNTGKASQVPG